MNTKTSTKQTPSAAAEKPAHDYGVWGFTYGFIGATETIEAAKTLIAEFSLRNPSVKLYNVYLTEPGKYEKNHRVYSEGYPKNQQDIDAERIAKAEGSAQ